MLEHEVDGLLRVQPIACMPVSTTSREARQASKREHADPVEVAGVEAHLVAEALRVQAPALEERGRAEVAPERRQVCELLGDGDLEVVPGDRLVVGEHLRLVARPGLRVRGIEVVLPGPGAVVGRLAVVGDGRVLLLVRAHAHDVARRLREAAEPVGDGLGGPLEGRGRLGEHLVARRKCSAGSPRSAASASGRFRVPIARPASSASSASMRSISARPVRWSSSGRRRPARCGRGPGPGRPPRRRAGGRGRAGPPGARRGGSRWRAPRGGGRTPAGSRRRPRPGGRPRTARAPPRTSAGARSLPAGAASGASSGHPRPGARAARPGCPPPGRPGRGRRPGHRARRPPQRRRVLRRCRRAIARQRSSRAAAWAGVAAGW